MLANDFRVTKIHRALQFDQKPYMKTFIDTFVSKHSEQKAMVKQDIFKIILNSALGKICEIVHHRSRCDFINDSKEYARIIADLNFASFMSIYSNMILSHRKKA